MLRWRVEKGTLSATAFGRSQRVWRVLVVLRCLGREVLAESASVPAENKATNVQIVVRMWRCMVSRGFVLCLDTVVGLRLWIGDDVLVADVLIWQMYG